MKRMTIVKRMTIMSIYPIGPQHLFYIALFRQTEIVGRVVLSTLFAIISIVMMMMIRTFIEKKCSCKIKLDLATSKKEIIW